VNADLAEGQSLGVNGTPGFFVNGYPVPGAQPYDVFQQVIALAEEGRLAEAYQSQPATNNNPPQAGQPVAVPLSDEPAKGSPDAPITIVEYSDYQCPFCLRHFQQTLPQLQSYIDAGQVRYVFKDFPIHSLHPQAQKAHESARCARELGGDEAFWTMHDMLFANQEQWAGNPNHVDVYKSFAGEMELPPAEFNECLDSGRYADAVNAQVNEGAQLGVRGTPSFFINGQLLVGAQPFDVFQQAIETLLADGSS
jgi:protein-disulfide isomerase